MTYYFIGYPEEDFITVTTSDEEYVIAQVAGYFVEQASESFVLRSDLIEFDVGTVEVFKDLKSNITTEQLMNLFTFIGFHNLNVVKSDYLLKLENDTTEVVIDDYLDTLFVDITMKNLYDGKKVTYPIEAFFRDTAFAHFD